MKLFHNGIFLCALVTLAAMNSAVLTGCDDSGSGKAPAAATKDDHDHDHDADHADHADHDHGTAAKDDHSDHDHGAPAKDDHADQDDHGHGAVTALGETSAGGFMVNASLDGALAAGKEAAIDVAISSATAKAARARVRPRESHRRNRVSTLQTSVAADRSGSRRWLAGTSSRASSRSLRVQR